MAQFLPLFPLSLIVFPGEQLRLHIFEPRYKQLITECNEEKKTFGIPSVIDQNVSEIATEVRIVSIDKQYKSGEMDITAVGMRRFQIEEFFKVSEGKLYPGGNGTFIPDTSTSSEELQAAIFDQLNQLHLALGITKKLASDQHDIQSFRIGHHIGLTIQQEYELLRINVEKERLAYIHSHLTGIIPIVTETERLKAKAKLNGHYKNIVPPDF